MSLQRILAAVVGAKADTLAALVDQYQADGGVRGALEHEQEVSIDAMKKNDAYSKANGGVTSGDPEADLAVGQARRAVEAARRAASGAVAPGFVALHLAAAGEVATALTALVERHGHLAAIEAGARACGVRVPSLCGLLPDADVERAWRAAASAAGVPV